MTGNQLLVLAGVVGLSVATAPPPEGGFPPGYLELGGDYVKDLVDKNRQLGNQVVSIVSGATQGSLGLYKDALQLGTNVGKTATSGAVDLGHKAVHLGTSLANQGLGMASTVGDMLPSVLGHVVHGATGLGGAAVGTAGKVTDWGLDAVGSVGNKGMSMATSVVEKGTGAISSVVQAGSSKIQSGINTVADGIIDRLDNSIKAIENLFPHFGGWTTR